MRLLDRNKTEPQESVGEIIEQVVELVRSDYEAYLALGPTIAKRDQHSQQDVGLRGKLIVRLQRVPEQYRYGLFAQDGTYDVVARWSPNAALPLPRDAHGMAVKILEAQSGIDHDLLMANSPVFMAGDARAVLDLMRAKSAGGGMRQMARYFVPHANLAGWRIRELINTISMVGHRVDNPLLATYYSPTAMTCGPFAVRYVARPWRSSVKLSEQLDQEGTTFDLCLQTCPSHLVDDPTRRCREILGPVAELVFPHQEPIDCEDLSFSLSHHHPEHPSLGEVAAVREAVYPVIARLRQSYNKERVS